MGLYWGWFRRVRGGSPPVRRDLPVGSSLKPLSGERAGHPCLCGYEILIQDGMHMIACPSEMTSRR